MMEDVSDELLMALADGELDRGETARLRLRMRSDPALAARFAVFVESRALIEGERQADVPVPPALRAAIETLVRPTPAVPLAAAEQPSSAPSRQAMMLWWPTALAASLALVVGGALGWGVATRSDAPADTFVTNVPAVRDAVRAALARLPAGEVEAFREAASEQSGRVAVVATHRLANGRVCRRFEVALDPPGSSREIGLACRDGEAWRTELLARVPAEDSYSPASGEADPLDRYLEAMGSAAPVAPEEERELLRTRARE